MKLKHYLDTQDLTSQEILNLLDLIRVLKDADKARCLPPLLEGVSLGMVFEEPSTRTRVSFEVAMTKLGGHALYLKPGEIHLGERESLADTARVLSRMCDILMARTLKHETMLELAKYATVPVLNGLTDYNHPTQVLCDVFTMQEFMPAGKHFSDLNVTFVGDATNVLSSLMHICTQLGIHFTHAAPKAYQPPKRWIEIAEENCKNSGGTLEITEDVGKAVSRADFIYTDLWWWVGQEDEIPDRRKAFMPKYQITTDLLKKAPSHVKLMHCLPASRNVEATDDALDSNYSIIFDQAENRLHTQKALLVAFLYPLLKKNGPEEKKVWKDKIHTMLQKF